MSQACSRSLPTAGLSGVELEAIDLAGLVGQARDAGHEVMLMERGAGAYSVAGIGRRFELLSTPQGVALEDARGRRLFSEAGEDRLAAAARLWRRLAGLCPLAIGGFAFDPDRDPGGPWEGFPSLLFRVPELTVTRGGDRTIATGNLELLEFAPSWRGPSARRLEVESVRPETCHLAIVTEASRRLRAGEAEKVVLAREVLARADGVVTAEAVVRSLHDSHPSSFTYLVTGSDGTAFAGASPELLVRRLGSRIESQPMAGSIGRGEDTDADDALADRLRGSAKDTLEHQVTASHVAQVLSAVCGQVQVADPRVERLANIQHLATSIEGRLEDPELGLLDLAALLHPTPAVGGHPVAAARAMISELEQMERGWYGGGVGWIDAAGNGELAVAIRCGLLYEDGARLYAGGGIMPDSDPQAELEETRLKLRDLQNALVSC